MLTFKIYVIGKICFIYQAVDFDKTKIFAEYRYRKADSKLNNIKVYMDVCDSKDGSTSRIKFST